MKMKSGKALTDLTVWEVLRRELILDLTPWLRLWREAIRLADGRVIDDYVQIEQRDYVEVVAWQDGKALGLWRYKHGPRRVNLGLPAGYLDPGESAIDAARRELQEEAGLASDNWQSLGSYCIDGNRGQACAHIWAAHHCRTVAARPSDDLEVHVEAWLTPQQWSQHLADGSVATLGAAIAVYAAILAPSQRSQ
jgi:ADP-ribose pyrophosphatase